MGLRLGIRNLRFEVVKLGYFGIHGSVHMHDVTGR